MDFDIDVLALQKAIKALAVAVVTNSDDVTNSILIETTDNSLVLASNNGSISVSYDASKYSRVHKPGKALVPFSKIKTFIMSHKYWDGNSGAKDFNVVVKGNKVVISTENLYGNGRKTNGELSLANSNTSTFPKPATFDTLSFTMNSKIFKNAVNKVLYAINPSTDFSQPALQGMNIQFTKDNITFAGSDGVVLSEYQIKNMNDYIGDSITLQYDFIMGLRRLMVDGSIILWEISKNKVNVKFDDIVLSGRHIIGHKFPDYAQVFNNYTHYVNLPKDFLVDSLLPFSNSTDAEDNFRLTIEIKDKTFKLFNNQIVIQSEQDIEGGLNFSIDLNGKYLINTIEAIKDDHILFKFSDSNGHAIFDSSTFNDQKALISSIKKR